MKPQNLLVRSCATILLLFFIINLLSIYLLYLSFICSCLFGICFYLFIYSIINGLVVGMWRQIDKDMRVKVCDFGLSVVKPRGEVLRDKDSIPGTPLWMSPEVLQGKDVDEKADVYSYGLVLWVKPPPHTHTHHRTRTLMMCVCVCGVRWSFQEILSRAEPFLHHDNYAMFKRSVCFKNERPPMPENCLPSLRYLIEACWQKEPTKRPSFAQIIPMLDIGTHRTHRTRRTHARTAHIARTHRTRTHGLQLKRVACSGGGCDGGGRGRKGPVEEELPRQGRDQLVPPPSIYT
jgi:serine/threonine protein kinase